MPCLSTDPVPCDRVKGLCTGGRALGLLSYFITDVTVSGVFLFLNFRQALQLPHWMKRKEWCNYITQIKTNSFFSFEELIGELESLIEERKRLEEERKLSILREKTIVAMTITGAAINSSLLQKLGPRS